MPQDSQRGKRVNDRNAGRVECLPCVHPLVGDAGNIGRGGRGGSNSRAACRERAEHRKVIRMLQGCPAAHPQADKCQEERAPMQNKLCHPPASCHCEAILPQGLLKGKHRLTNGAANVLGVVCPRAGGPLLCCLQGAVMAFWRRFKRVSTTEQIAPSLVQAPNERAAAWQCQGNTRACRISLCLHGLRDFARG